MLAFEKKKKAAFYGDKIFEKNNTARLQSYFTINLKTRKCGRSSRDDFDECSTSIKRRKIQLIREKYSETKIELAFLQNLRDSGKTKIANMINDLLLKTDDDTESLKKMKLFRFQKLKLQR